MAPPGFTKTPKISLLYTHTKPAGKVMLILFSNHQCSLVQQYIHKETTVTTASQCDLLKNHENSHHIKTTWTAQYEHPVAAQHYTS
jgi:hypothetical protein